jgi:hypothetical protein
MKIGRAGRRRRARRGDEVQEAATMARKTRRVEPAIDGLETRCLLSAGAITPNSKSVGVNALQAASVPQTTAPVFTARRLLYTTAQGTRVDVNVYGAGTLAGSFLDADGALHLIYNDTTVTTRIIGATQGGTGFAPLVEVRDADVPARSASATDSEPVSTFNFRNFNLVDGGYLNLAGGVNILTLNSVGRDTQLHLKANPVSTSSTSSNASASLNPGIPSGSSAGSTTVIGGTTTTTGTSGSGSPTTNTSNVGTGGTTLGTTSSSVTVSASSSTKATPTGVEVTIPHVLAGPLGTPPIGPTQIFGYDPKAGALLRFNATTGDVLQAIPVPSGGQPMAGVGLGRDAGRLVVLVGTGPIVRAFDVVTGTAVGQFSTADLASIGLKNVDGIGSSDVRTVLSDSTAGAPLPGTTTPTGLAILINVTASLAAGVAIPAGAPFSPQRQLSLLGEATGVAGSDLLYATAAAHFDSFQPSQNQLGILALSASSTGTLRESSRTRVPGTNSPFINVVPGPTGPTNPPRALGSIDGDLALVTSLENGRNIVTRYNPSTLAANGQVGLATPNLLDGLSESFHPELLNAALIDVQGNLRNFIGRDASGLIINDNGTLNLVAIGSATDTAVIGQPLNHVEIPHRNNVQLLSTARGTHGVSTRGGVVSDKNLGVVGPLTLP